MRDVDAAMRRYVNDDGVGQWRIHELDPVNVNDFRENGQPVERSWRLKDATRCRS